MILKKSLLSKNPAKGLVFPILIVGGVTCTNNPEIRNAVVHSDSAAAREAWKPPELRDSVRRYPVASYEEKTDNPLNDWYFRVQLFETKATFRYLLKLQFEEIRGEDSVSFPNFGKMPTPVIRKGSEKYSCLLGFLDKDSVFREYKKIYVQEDKLKVTTLRHYAVYTTSRKTTE